MLYAILGLLGIIIYYPVATFMYPNLQFGNKALDVKFNPDFMIYQNSGKLIIAGVSTFFPEQDQLGMQLASSAFVSLIMVLISLKSDTCLLAKINKWILCGYSVAFWCCICAFFKWYFPDKIDDLLLLIILYIVGASIILITLLYQLIKEEKVHQKIRNCCKKESPAEQPKISQKNSSKLENQDKQKPQQKAIKSVLLDTKDNLIINEELKQEASNAMQKTSSRFDRYEMKIEDLNEEDKEHEMLMKE